MAEEYHVSHAPDYFSGSADPEYMRLNADCFNVATVHFCAAGSFDVGQVNTEQGSFAAIMLSSGRTGLHWQMPPAGARQLAEALLKMAGIIEAQAADQAKALLDATLGKDRPA